MTDYLKSRWLRMGAFGRAVCCAVLAVCAAFGIVALAADLDNDGMDDAFETFFGLSTSTSTDSPAESSSLVRRDMGSRKTTRSGSTTARGSGRKSRTP